MARSKQIEPDNWPRIKNRTYIRKIRFQLKQNLKTR